MGSPQYSILYSSPLSSSVASGGAMDVLINDAAAPTGFVLATTANRAGRRSTGLALSDYSAGGVVDIQQEGQVAAAVVGIGAGAASLVRVSVLGKLERIASPGTTDDVVGYVETDGTLHCRFGQVPGGYGASSSFVAPTGTGIVVTTAGVLNAAALANPGAGTFQLQSIAGALTWVSLAVAPTVTSVSTGIGDIGGGYSTTVIGSNFVIGATTFTFGGVAATGVVVSSATLATMTIPAHATGVVSVVATTAGGSSAANSLFEFYSPAQEALTMWHRASYAGSPWAAVSSAGSSGLNGNFTEATNPPSVGTALNGRTPATFNGTTQTLTSAQNLNVYINVAAWSLSVLVRPTATAAARSVGAGYNDPAIIGETTQGYWYLTYTTSGVTIGHYDPTAGTWKEATQACVAGAWHLVHAWFDGVNISISVDSVAATSVASTDQGIIGVGPLMLSRNFAGGSYAACDVEEVWMSATDLGSTSRSKAKAYVNTRYGLSL